jgi:hypothetical protein
LPHTEHVPCQFHLIASGEQHRPFLEIEYLYKALSALENPTKRVFFTFHDKVTWDEAETLVGGLNTMIRHMAVTAYAPGESM